MKSKQPSTKITVYITTYTKPPLAKRDIKMSKNYGCRDDHNSRFICSVCLNTSMKDEEKKYEFDKRKSKSCPICQTPDVTPSSCERTNHESKKEYKVDDISTKNIQTSRTNIDQGLNLLNEVLTVFQNKKGHNAKDNRFIDSKTIMFKDACVSTQLSMPKITKLSFSKVFQLSIEGSALQESGKFSIVDSCQPKVTTRSQYSIDLIKHKSSSIPQMKLEELKKSLQERTKINKDAIEEVNRMFATVKRNDSFEEINRPLIRNGPRVLPVVKTNATGRRYRTQSGDDLTDQSNQQSCKCCQANYYMSSGDSLTKQERCEKNAMQCCHKSRDLRNHVANHDLVCECCRKPVYDK